MEYFRKLGETPSQTAGPFLHIGCTPNYIGLHKGGSYDLGRVISSEKVKGERISLTGKVFDGNKMPLKDGLVEIWQSDSEGIYNSRAETRGAADPHFHGWGRCACDLKTGIWKFETIKPGSVQLSNKTIMAPHISFWLVARGINIGLNTRMYFGDEETLNKQDPLLKTIQPKDRIKSILATKIGDGRYEFNIFLQGNKETIFFEI